MCKTGVGTNNVDHGPYIVHAIAYVHPTLSSRARCVTTPRQRHGTPVGTRKSQGNIHVLDNAIAAGFCMYATS